MSMEAPGTYHHSLMVANLAEAAAEAVGASASMCRVCSYFHDIGKIDKASYFIENMNQDHNPHDDLTPTMSALVIISHVKDGVDMALKHRLNWRIIDVIEQHHGTSSVYYFYRKALTQRETLLKAAAEGKGNKDDIPDIREESFRYPGPRPQSREAAIISLADSIESASRTLEKPTPQKIATLVEEIIFNRLKEGQLSECELSMREINLIRQSFISSLRSMMHNRIAYPKEDKQHAKGEQQRGSKRYQSGQIGHPGHTGPIRLPATPAREQPSSAAGKAPESPPVDAEKTGEPTAPVEKESCEEAKASIETMVPRSLWSMM
jgi:cyclic-di-AMP phosphodiesterase PgpH